MESKYPACGDKTRLKIKMKKNYGILTIAAIILPLAIFFLLVFFSEKEKFPVIPQQGNEKTARQPAAAGVFYPASKEELDKQISQFLGNAQTPITKGYVKMIVVPHAAYPYSGQVAAYGYKALSSQLQKNEPLTVILMGSSHFLPVKDIAIDANDVWRTPLGEVPIDNDLREALVKENALFKIDSNPHNTEHSLEVQIPFLQEIFTNFKILPMLSNELSAQELENASQTLASYVGKTRLLLPVPTCRITQHTTALITRTKKPLMLS